MMNHASINRLPDRLRMAGYDVPAADGKKVPLYLFRLPDGSDMEMVVVPAGDFITGTSDQGVPDWEKATTTASITHSYWIGRNIVTRGQYKSFTDATNNIQPKSTYFDDQLPANKNSQPVVMVSWNEAHTYAQWAGLDIPSEVEWEKAARGTDGRRYPWGNAWEFGKSNYLDASTPGDKIMMGEETLDEHMAAFGGRDLNHNDGFPYTSPVGSFPEGASPYGALDMAGNVFQWVEDWWDEKGFPQNAWHVDRGSSWGNPGVMANRTTMRFGYTPNEQNEHLGFRVILRAN